MNNYSYQNGAFMPYQGANSMPNYGQQQFNPQMQQMYQNQQQYQQQMQPQMQPQFTPVFKSNIEYVNGIEGAKSFVIAPNSKLLLMDSDDNYFYIKTTDIQGKPTVKTFKYIDIEKEKEKENQKNDEQKQEPKQILKTPTLEEFNTLSENFETFKKQVIEQFKSYKQLVSEKK